MSAEKKNCTHCRRNEPDHRQRELVVIYNGAASAMAKSNIEQPYHPFDKVGTSHVKNEVLLLNQNDESHWSKHRLLYGDQKEIVAILQGYRLQTQPPHGHPVV